jgi:predicted SAM-dependent methyltransferase
MKKQKFLHIGCGLKRKESTTPVFNTDDWEEVTLDIDKRNNPDILASFTDLSGIKSSSFDAIFSSHNIEHIFYHEALIAIKEFYRILKPNGYIYILCPDLVSVCEALIERGPNEPLYNTSNGSYVAASDMLYGWRGPIESGNKFMAHKFGYSEKTLISAFQKGGFSNIVSSVKKQRFEICLLACCDELYNTSKNDNDKKSMIDLFRKHSGYEKI